MRNVAVVYIDVRGVGRKAILKGSAKGFVKAKLKGGEVVKLQSEDAGGPGGAAQIQEGDVEKGTDGEIVVGMAEVGLDEKTIAQRQEAERVSNERVAKAKSDLAAIESMRD